MRALVVGLVAIAACSEAPGVELEVMRTNVPGVVSVQLFIGEECRNNNLDCPRAFAPINQDNQQLKPRVTDMAVVNGPVLEVKENEWHGDAAGFHVLSGTTTKDYVPVMVAVGFDANGRAIADVTFGNLFVPVDHGEHWRAYLEPAEEMTDPEVPSEMEKIAIWPGASRNGNPPCVMVEHPHTTGDTLVPADDTDCDGRANECAVFNPNAQRVPPTIAGTSCITYAESANISPPLCMLGGTPCNELSPAPPSACDTLDVDYCLPQGICTGCIPNMSPYSIDYSTCLMPGRFGASAFPFVKCTVPMQPDGKECPSGGANEGDITFDALFAGTPTTCRDMGIDDGVLPLDFQSTLAIGATGKVLIKDIHEPCNASIVWSGDHPPTGSTGTPAFVMTDLDMDNGKHMIVMTVLVFAADCNTPIHCEGPMFQATDSILSCAKPAMSSTTCTPQSAMCGGQAIACGSHCCNPGERCLDGVCRCGDGPHCVDTACVDAANPNVTPPMNGCGNVCCGTYGVQCL